MQTESDNSNNHTQKELNVDFRKHYPLSHRRVIKKTFPWLVGFLLIAFILLVFHTYQDSVIDDQELLRSLDRGSFFLVGMVFLVCLIKFVYEELYRACYYYGIESGHFVISKGVVLKHRGSFPLSRITDVYLDRSVADFCFGIYNLHVLTPTAHSGEFARIDGLSKYVGLQFQRRLAGILDMAHRPIEEQMHEMNDILETRSAAG